MRSLAIGGGFPRMPRGHGEQEESQRLGEGLVLPLCCGPRGHLHAHGVLTLGSWKMCVCSLT